jgi:hypothetical protein
MKANEKTKNKMEWAKKSGQMGLNMLESLKMAANEAMVSLNGATAAHTQENFTKTT